MASGSCCTIVQQATSSGTLVGSTRRNYPENTRKTTATTSNQDQPTKRYALQTASESVETSIIRGTLFYEFFLAKTLFDTIYSRSFITTRFERTLRLELTISNSITSVNMPLGTCVTKLCPS